ncbi:lamin tail domain-containing protein [Halobacterium hubeiense]|uniref:lamin tail domain-containing protein n=1 Tax=Halobacterium hubeiense TaxID=1407499 RepID=UPI003C730E64
MTRRRALGVLAVAALVLLAGCSGAVTDAPATTEAPETTNAPPTTESPTTQVATPNGTLSVHFLNVGQGSSALVVGPDDETMLVDTGDWSDDGEVVLDYLQEQNIERVDYLVTSHADADHIGGHEAVIDYFETEAAGVGAAYDPGVASSSQTYREYLDAVEGHDVPLFQTRAGDEIPLGGDAIDVDVLGPPADRLAGGDRNENSVVLRVAFGESTFLLPGDVEEAGEQYLVEEYGAGVNATVLSAGHHGSASSSTSAFLDVVTPRVAVISSAYDSQYGHPHETVLQRFAERSVRTYWTATHGNVVVSSNGTAVTVATQRAAPTAPLDLRDADPIETGAGNDVEVRTVVPVSGTATVPDGGTTTEPTTEPTTSPEATSEASALSVAAVHADAAGNDNEHLNDEYVVFENTGDDPLALGGWTVSDEAGHTYAFPSGFTLGPGEEVTLHTGSGTDSVTDLYWGAGSAVWNNAGDTIVVETDTGTTVVEATYE